MVDRLTPHADVLQEVDALDELHREEPVAAILDQLTQADEIRVMHVLERPELVLEAQHRIRRDRPKGLEGDAAVVFAVEGLVDDAHATRTEPADDLEARRSLKADVG